MAGCQNCTEQQDVVAGAAHLASRTVLRASLLWSASEEAPAGGEESWGFPELCDSSPEHVVLLGSLRPLKRLSQALGAVSLRQFCQVKQDDINVSIHPCKTNSYAIELERCCRKSTCCWMDRLLLHLLALPHCWAFLQAWDPVMKQLARALAVHWTLPSLWKMLWCHGMDLSSSGDL